MGTWRCSAAAELMAHIDIGAFCVAGIGVGLAIFTTYGVILCCAYATVVRTFVLGYYPHLRT